jgi:hypothetical protein
MKKPNTLNPTESAAITARHDAALRFIVEQNRLPKAERNERRLAKEKRVRDTTYRWLHGHAYKPYKHGN